MSRLLQITALLLLFGITLPLPAHALIPDPTKSKAPRCLRVCPHGDFDYVVEVRDVTNTPIPGVTVTIIFNECPEVHVCDVVVNDPYTWNSATRVVAAVTNAAGQVNLPLRAGGTCVSSHINVRMNGILLQSVYLASPDQDGDQMVLASDVAAIDALIGTEALGADLDCDGAVTAQDVAIAESHLNHNCSGPTRVEPAGWGRIKAYYR